MSAAISLACKFESPHTSEHLAAKEASLSTTDITGCNRQPSPEGGLEQHAVQAIHPSQGDMSDGANRPKKKHCRGNAEFRQAAA